MTLIRTLGTLTDSLTEALDRFGVLGEIMLSCRFFPLGCSPDSAGRMGVAFLQGGGTPMISLTLNPKF